MMAETVLPIIITERCILCGDCISVCPFHALGLAETAPYFVSPENCTYCGKCEETCPESAIRCPLTIVWDNAQ